ncbi:DUF7482 domain-containing protein [Paludibaculum fermentans]|uniref:DUF7482 domain-containing protein n=1 Tax=Paludibaculum fermentans TaxID=1473598 RepID=UPI003EBE79D5
MKSMIQSGTWSRIRTLAALMLGALPVAVMAQPSPGVFGPGPGCNVFPASASVGATVGLSYFGPPPSSTNPSLVGPVQLLKSGVVDEKAGTITLPLYRGTLNGSNKPVWFILTDVNDAQVADFLGINYSAKLNFTANGARNAWFDAANNVVFDRGTVDFTPARKVVAGSAAAPFPPSAAEPGSVGDDDYSPLIKLGNIIYNAPVVAFGLEAADINFPAGNPDYTKVHDEVLAIDTTEMTVTLQLVNGFSFGRPVWYISTEASLANVAAIEGATFAPRLQKLVTGRDDSFSSPVERIFIAVNGPSEDGCANPMRQGLYAALTDGYRPNNVFGGIPTIAPDYSPLWNGNLYEWTQPAVARGYRGQLREEFQILTYVQDGLLTGPGGSKFGDSQFIVNCPPVQRLN